MNLSCIRDTIHGTLNILGINLPGIWETIEWTLCIMGLGVNLSGIGGATDGTLGDAGSELVGYRGHD